MYKSMRGKPVDMGKLVNQNELAPAVGNAGFNARGDKIGPGGKIIQTREAMMAEYHETSPKAKMMATSGPASTKNEKVVEEEKPTKNKKTTDEA